MTELYDLTLRLVKDSICPCGYQLMDTPIGTLYRAISQSKTTGILQCGGCGAHLNVNIIKCDQKLHPDRPAQFLALDAMEVVEQ